MTNHVVSSTLAVALAFLCLRCSGDRDATGAEALDAGGATGGAACLGCHDLPPSTGRDSFHAKMLNCDSCHSCVVDRKRQIIDPAKHNSGTTYVCRTDLTYDFGARTCSNVGCHDSRTW